MNEHVSALLMPKEFEHTVVHCGAELVVERSEEPASALDDGAGGTDSSAAGTVRRFLHILDEDERADKLRAGELAPALRAVHENQLRELAWARATLWGDARIQAFLTSASPVLWPSVRALTPVVEIAQQLKRYADRPANARGADDLRRALDVLTREAQHTGLHPLKEAPVAGRLTLYAQGGGTHASASGSSAVVRVSAGQQEEGISGRTGSRRLDDHREGDAPSGRGYKRVREEEHAASRAAGSGEALSAGTTLHRVDHLCMAPTALLLVPHRTVYLTSEVLALPLTTRTREALVTRLQRPAPPRPHPHLDGTSAAVTAVSQSATTPPPAWSTFLALHRRSLCAGHGLGLIYSVQEMMRQFNILDEGALGQMMEYAERQQNRLRLRGGVYATVLHRTACYLLHLPPSRWSTAASSAPLAALTREERAAFRRSTGRRYADCVAEGAVHVLPACRAGADDDTAASLPSSSWRDDRRVAFVRPYLRERFLSPVLHDCPEADDCYTFCDRNDHTSTSVVSMSLSTTRHAPRTALTQDDALPATSEEKVCDGAQLMYVRADFNPFIVVHGAHVEGGFVGRSSVYEALRQARDAVAEEQTELLLRRSHAESTTGATSMAAAHGGVGGSHARVEGGGEEGLSTRRERASGATTEVTALRPSSSSSSSSVVTGEERRQALTSTVIEILSQGPQTRAEIVRHEALAPWRRAPELDAVLRQVLKAHAEYRGRKFQLR